MFGPSQLFPPGNMLSAGELEKIIDESGENHSLDQVNGKRKNATDSSPTKRIKRLTDAGSPVASTANSAALIPVPLLALQPTITLFGHTVRVLDLERMKNSILSALENHKKRTLLKELRGETFIALATPKRIHLIAYQKNLIAKNKLGNGSFGVVFRVDSCRIRLADNQISMRSLALKHSFPNIHSMNQAINEYEILEQLGSVGLGGIQKPLKGILKTNQGAILHFGTYYNRLSLHQCIKHILDGQAPASSPDLVSLVRSLDPLFDSLKALHDANFKHGDITLKNILVRVKSDETLEVVLADFGGARTYADLKAQWEASQAAEEEPKKAIRRLLGSFTPCYLPLCDIREMWMSYKNKVFDQFWDLARAADVFMLGCTLFHVMKISGGNRAEFPAKDFHSLNDVGVTMKSIECKENVSIELPEIGRKTPQLVQNFLIARGWHDSEMTKAISNMMLNDPYSRLAMFESLFE